MDAYYKVIQHLPPTLERELERLPSERAKDVHEIRLRTGCPPLFTVGGVLKKGEELFCSYGTNPFWQREIEQNELEECFYSLCGHSVPTHQEELAEGYFTLLGGHRVGVGGRYLLREGRATLLTVQSLNLRIARVYHCEISPSVCSLLQGNFSGLLVVGEPDSGKTTFLRSIAQRAAEYRKTVAVIDERGELFSQTAFQKSCFLDVLTGIPKAMGVQFALRSLSPRLIVLDELGTMEEVKSLEMGFFGGVGIVASLHASSWEEACCRPQVQYMIEHQMLTAALLLWGRKRPTEIRAFYDMTKQNNREEENSLCR